MPRDINEIGDAARKAYLDDLLERAQKYLVERGYSKAGEVARVGSLFGKAQGFVAR